MQSDISTLFDLRSKDQRDMRSGIAAAIAIGSAPMPSEPGRVSYTVNGSTFRGQYGVGGEFKYRLNTKAPMAVGLGFSAAGHDNNSARVNISGEF
jgi:hypothetical protein